MRNPQHRLIALAALALASACARAEIGEARYAADQCQRVTLNDAQSGEAIRGAEDFAFDRDRQILFVSAYDRRAVEKAARKKREALPQGGVYPVALASLFDPDVTALSVTSLAAPGDIVGGLHPHGISYDAANHELLFINRTYQRVGRTWKMTPQLQRIGANGEVFVGAAASAHCAANDVVAAKDNVLTSFDHGACGLGAGIENVFRAKRSGVMSDGGQSFNKAVFANGLAEKDGAIYLAATRENALLVLQQTPDGISEATRVKLPGGPDNITVGEDGSVIAAVHPSMRALMFNRKFGIGKSPSRIVKADVTSGEVEILFDDPKGKIFSAATVAVETQFGLVAGSVTDEGLLVCRAAP